MPSWLRVFEPSPLVQGYNKITKSNLPSPCVVDDTAHAPDAFCVATSDDIEMRSVGDRHRNHHHHPHRQGLLPALGLGFLLPMFGISQGGDYDQDKDEDNGVRSLLDPNAARTSSFGSDKLSGGEEASQGEAEMNLRVDRPGKNMRSRGLQGGRSITREITDDERREADKKVVWKLLINATFIGLWYLFSLSISLYNKWMFGSKRLNFAFPLFITSSHMLVQFGLASIVLYLFPRFRPRRHFRGMSDGGRSRYDSEPTLDGPVMSKIFFFTRVVPCGLATGLDIGLGNMSLMMITLTFYTMCKSSSIGFVLLFAFIFGLEQPTWRLVAIVALMTAGVIMMVAGEVEFNLAGFALIISAALFSGFRWSLTQTMLLHHPATSNPFSSIFYLAPVMFLVLLLLALFVEGPLALFKGLTSLAADWGFVTPIVLLSPGILAFLMTASEFALLQRTSAVTLSVAGIFKEVVTLTAAALVFDDKLTLVNTAGLATIMAAIAAYNWIKISKMRRDAQFAIRRRHRHSGAPRLALDPSSTPSFSASSSDTPRSSSPLSVSPAQSTAFPLVGDKSCPDVAIK